MSGENEQSVTRAVGEYVGMVKWFNNRRGYGFIKTVSESRNGDDIFVHQSNVCPESEGYRTLSAGEYVSFNISNIEGQDQEQALDVTGVFGGPLLCDTQAQQPPQFQRTGRGRGGRNFSGSGRGRGGRSNRGDGEQATETGASA
jgi:cold shock CspA family protein